MFINIMLDAIYMFIHASNDKIKLKRDIKYPVTNDEQAHNDMIMQLLVEPQSMNVEAGKPKTPQNLKSH